MSAPALLLTLLGEFVLPGGGSVWTGTLVEALGVLGVEEGAARQAIARSSAKGLLQAERLGRRTRWALTDWARRILAEGAERIYTFGRARDDWDGVWLLVLTTVPEENRHLRAQVRTRLGWLGFGSLGAGVWVTPWAERERAAMDALVELGLADGALSWRGRPGALGSVEQRIGEIWDLSSLAAEYEDFEASARVEVPAEPQQSFTALTRLVHDWRHFPAADPGLPTRLLPESWPGPHAARVFHQFYGAWEPDAQAWWQDRISADC